MDRIVRKDPHLNELIEVLNFHYEKAHGDVNEASLSLSSYEKQIIDEEISRCSHPITGMRYYLENYHVIATEHEGLRTLNPLWDSQEIFFEKCIEIMVAGRQVKVLVLKARQLGLSTISEGMIFWKTIFTEVCNALVVAQDPGQADYLFGMSRRAYDRLPWWMRPEARYEAKGRYLQLDRKDEYERVINPGLQSAIFVEAANKMTGVAVGKTIRAAHLSELSAWPNPEVLSTQIFPSMNAPDTLAIMESTARGRNNLWFRFWRDAANGKNKGWTPIFIEFFRVKKYFLPIPASMQFKLSADEEALRRKIKATRGVEVSDGQFYWKREKIKEYVSLHGDPWKFYQEYPSATWMEAFQGTGICAFNKYKLQAIRETTVCPPRWVGEITLESALDKTYRLKGQIVGWGDNEIPPDSVPEAEEVGSRLYIWETPERGESYYISGDVAHGLVGGDYSCAQIIKIGHGLEPDVQVACWHGWINPTPYASVLAALGYYYNSAQIAVECNDVGNTTNSELMRILEYQNLFRWKHYDKIKHSITDWFGWYTNSKTRDLIIAKFREAIDDGSIILRDDFLVEECMDFSSDEGSRFEGQEANDDRVIAIMIARWCAHDSDFGKIAAAKPRSADKDDFWHMVFDSLFRLRGTFPTEEEANEFAAGKAGWTVRKGAAKVDYANSDYSPVHDKKGAQHDLHYKQGVPEYATHELALYGESSTEPSSPEDQWRLF